MSPWPRSFHNDVAMNGPLFVGANGRVASTNHIGYFQYGPAGAVQLEPLLAPGGNPVAGAGALVPARARFVLADASMQADGDQHDGILDGAARCRRGLSLLAPRLRRRRPETRRDAAVRRSIELRVRPLAKGGPKVRIVNVYILFKFNQCLVRESQRCHSSVG